MEAIINSYVSMSIDKVEGNDDLLASVLVQLPPKAVFRFMCVSKRWESIIINPFFRRSYRATARRSNSHPAAFFQCCPRNLHFLQTNDHSFKDIPEKLKFFIGSSNGLILCLGEGTYHIFSPLTGVCISLPKPSTSAFPIANAGLVIEENTNGLKANYKVVKPIDYWEDPKPNTWPIEIYSSTTGKWSPSLMICNENFKIDNRCSKPLLVFNGILHWWLLDKKIMLFDSSGATKEVQLINLPDNIAGKRLINSALTRSRIDDLLGYCINTPEGVAVWELPKNGHCNYWRSDTIPGIEWTFKYKITFNSVLKEYNRTRFDELLTGAECFPLEAWIPGSSNVVVLRQGERLFLYNLENKSVELVQYHSALDKKDLKGIWYPYMMSFSLSSYTLQGHCFC